jgi:hypothetical protein
MEGSTKRHGKQKSSQEKHWYLSRPKVHEEEITALHASVGSTVFQCTYYQREHDYSTSG